MNELIVKRGKRINSVDLDGLLPVLASLMI